VGDKVRKIERPDIVYTVVNNDPPGNVILIFGRLTRIASRPVHHETWERDPDQSEDQSAREWQARAEFAEAECERLRRMVIAMELDRED
jgi:hypothetical protein